MGLIGQDMVGYLMGSCMVDDNRWDCINSGYEEI